MVKKYKNSQIWPHYCSSKPLVHNSRHLINHARLRAQAYLAKASLPNGPENLEVVKVHYKVKKKEFTFVNALLQISLHLKEGRETTTTERWPGFC